MAQIIKGLQYLHAHGIMHRDLTATNILITDSDEMVGWRRTSGACRLTGSRVFCAPDPLPPFSLLSKKISDFGLAARMQSSADTNITMCGTANFIAP
jgi:polo-like kinase 4